MIFTVKISLTLKNSLVVILLKKLMAFTSVTNMRNTWMINPFFHYLGCNNILILIV